MNVQLRDASTRTKSYVIVKFMMMQCYNFPLCNCNFSRFLLRSLLDFAVGVLCIKTDICVHSLIRWNDIFSITRGGSRSGERWRREMGDEIYHFLLFILRNVIGCDRLWLLTLQTMSPTSIFSATIWNFRHSHSESPSMWRFWEVNKYKIELVFLCSTLHSRCF